jgi:thiosulfate/3-mercaptopyruvate sulfurtransferase
MLRVAVIIVLLIASVVAVEANGQFSIVTTKWVSEHSQDPDVLVIDVRADPHDYLIGHVPGAVNMSDAIMRGPLDGMPVQYLPVKQQAELLKRAGVRNGQTVVLYSDAQNVLGATMVAYCLERVGFPNIAVMDGGWSDYRAANSTSQSYPALKSGKLSVKMTKDNAVTLAEMKKIVADGRCVVIDARPDKAYTGEITTWMRNGHIPGAINVDWHSLTQDDNMHKFKSTEEMQKVYDKAGVKKSDDIVLYCGTNREATLEYMVMKHMLGYPKVRLYEGSWTEWCSYPDLPMETGNPKQTKNASVSH